MNRYNNGLCRRNCFFIACCIVNRFNKQQEQIEELELDNEAKSKELHELIMQVSQKLERLANNIEEIN